MGEGKMGWEERRGRGKDRVGGGEGESEWDGWRREWEAINMVGY